MTFLLTCFQRYKFYKRNKVDIEKSLNIKWMVQHIIVSQSQEYTIWAILMKNTRCRPRPGKCHTSQTSRGKRVQSESRTSCKYFSIELCTSFYFEIQLSTLLNNWLDFLLCFHTNYFMLFLIYLWCDKFTEILKILKI